MDKNYSIGYLQTVFSEYLSRELADKLSVSDCVRITDEAIKYATNRELVSYQSSREVENESFIK